MQLMSHMTWPEIDEYLNISKRPTVLVPISPIEEHGPHLPLGTDYLIAEVGAQRVAEEYRDCVIFPTIPLMCCGISEPTSGTYPIDGESLKTLVTQLIRLFARKGFKRILFLSMHGGYSVRMIREAIAELIKENKGQLVAEIIFFAEVFKPEPGLVETPNDVHAGEIETLVMMSVYPHLVRKPLPQADFHGQIDGKPAILSRSGICGDPQKASIQKGKRIVEISVQGIIEWLDNH